MHLTPDDLDALLLGTEDERVHVHLETCAECRALVVADRNIVLGLESLPRFVPSAGFADRVMARVAITKPVPVRQAVRVPALARAAVVALAFLGTLAGSISWSLANQGALMTWRGQLIRWIQSWVEAGFGGLLAQVSSIGWVAQVQQVAGSPARVALIGTALLLLYGAGLVALRRLTALPPSGTATHAA